LAGSTLTTIGNFNFEIQIKIFWKISLFFSSHFLDS